MMSETEFPSREVHRAAKSFVGTAFPRSSRRLDADPSRSTTRRTEGTSGQELVVATRSCPKKLLVVITTHVSEARTTWAASPT